MSTPQIIIEDAKKSLDDNVSTIPSSSFSHREKCSVTEEYTVCQYIPHPYSVKQELEVHAAKLYSLHIILCYMDSQMYKTDSPQVWMGKCITNFEKPQLQQPDGYLMFLHLVNRKGSGRKKCIASTSN